MNYLVEKKFLNDCKMLNWLATLSLHNYEYTEPGDGNSLQNAQRLVIEAKIAARNEKTSVQESQVHSLLFFKLLL